MDKRSDLDPMRSFLGLKRTISRWPGEKLFRKGLALRASISYSITAPLNDLQEEPKAWRRFLIIGPKNMMRGLKHPWADRRGEEGRKGHPIFRHIVFRSPEEVAGLSPVQGIIRTAIHFKKDDDLALAPEIEMEGRERGLNTGAFLAARWRKPK